MITHPKSLIVQIFCHAALTFALIHTAASLSAAVWVDPQGWTHIEPSSDSRIIYVSSSEGLDTNDGLTPETPVQSILVANQKTRDGYPDHILLKRGDVFSNAGSLGRWKNGRSLDEPALISYYGTSGPRPVIEPSGMFINHDGDQRSFIALKGLDFYRPMSDPESDRFQNASSEVVLRLIGRGNGILIEDCRFLYNSVVIQGLWDVFYRNVFIRRNIIFGNWIHGSSTEGNRVNGMFINNIDGPYVVEENFFDLNGWNPGIEGAGRNANNQNLFISTAAREGLIYRGNISTRSSSYGLLADSGGIADRNLFALNSVGVMLGVPWWYENGAGYTFKNRAEQNVVINGRRMSETGEETPHQHMNVFGIEAKLVPIAGDDNIVANPITGGAIVAYRGRIESDIENINYKWGRYSTNDPSWPNPDATLGDFNAFLGGSNDDEAYLAELRERPLGEFPWEMSAYAALTYFREGFNKGPVSGFYRFEDMPEVAVTGIEITPSTIHLDADFTTTIHASVFPDNASNPEILWSSANPSIARVNRYGQVTGLKDGSTQIIASTRDGGFAQAATVHVSGTVPVVSVGFHHATAAITAGHVLQLQPVFVPDYATNQNVSYTSNNEAVATVDENGLVTARSEGTARITALTEDGGHTAFSLLTVRAPTYTWAGYPGDPSNNIYTGGFLNWIMNLDQDWIWIWSIANYAYLPEAHVDAGGAWLYVPLTQPTQPGNDWSYCSADAAGWVHTDAGDGHFLNWIWVNDAPWIYSASLGKYIYLSENDIMPSGGWMYVYR